MRGGLTMLTLMALGSGCLQEQRYVVDHEPLALTADTEPAVVNDDDALFIVERRFELHVREPSGDDRRALRQQAQELELPYGRVPWVLREDVSLEVDWVLSNLGEEPVVVTLALNGVNEFHEYAPGPEDFNQFERRYRLEGRERRQGTIRQEQMDEVAVDLATVVNGAPNSNQIVYFENLSSLDPRARPFIPPVVPGLVGMRVGLIASEAADLVLEVSVRATDHGDRLVDQDKRWPLPNPELFVPVVPEEE